MGRKHALSKKKFKNKKIKKQREKKETAALSQADEGCWESILTSRGSVRVTD